MNSLQMIHKQNDLDVRELYDGAGRIKEVCSVVFCCCFFIRSLLSFMQMAIQINSEIKRGSAIADDIDKGLFDFEQVLRRSMRRLEGLHRNASSRHMFFLAIFVVLLFFFLYFMIR